MDDNVVLSFFICAILFLTLAIYVNHTERLALQLKDDVRKSLVDAGYDCHGQVERLSEEIDQLKRELEKKQRILEEHLKQQESGGNLQLKALEEHVHKIVISLRKPIDCTDIDVNHGSGIYTIYPIGIGSFRVYCDLETDKERRGWTVFQHRDTEEEDFNRGWIDYEYGFGNLLKEFWLGNRKLNALTDQGRYELAILIEDSKNHKTFSRYDFIKIGNGASNYKLSIGEYSGNAGNILETVNNMPFSTKDQDNDNVTIVHCAKLRGAAWWFSNSTCFDKYLNGRPYKSPFEQFFSVFFFLIDPKKFSFKSVQKTTMMIRRIT